MQRDVIESDSDVDSQAEVEETMWSRESAQVVGGQPSSASPQRKSVKFVFTNNIR